MKFLKKVIKIILILIFIILFLFSTSRIIKIVARSYFKLENRQVIEYYSDIYDVDPYLICAIIYTESKFNQYAVSHRGASGYMQLMERTAEWGANEIGIKEYSYDRIFEPTINIEIGTWYISTLTKQFKNLDVALASYNGGSGNVTSWLQDERYSKDGEILDKIPFKETEDYVERVNLFYKIYKVLYKGVF